MFLMLKSSENKKKKVVGRGRATGCGKTCGRGQKGHRSRTGYKILPGFEGGQMPLIRRVPKFGFSNARHQIWTVEINFSLLESKFSSGDEVSEQTLREKKIIHRSKKTVHIKLILEGKLTKSLTFAPEIVFSKGARESVGCVVRGQDN